MENLTLYIASFLAGLWNVFHEKIENLKQGVCYFVLGFSFCYTAATLSEAYGFDSKISTCIGYLCGMLSPSIYRMTVKILEKIPEMIEKKVNK